MKNPPWLLVPTGLIGNDTVITLDTAEGRHATGPLRLRSGDEVVLADGAGHTAAARLVVAGKTRVNAEIVSVRVEPVLPGDGVTLALAVIESKAMDWAVQKAVEIGVRRLQPIVTDRTQSGRRDILRAIGSLASHRSPGAQAVPSPMGDGDSRTAVPRPTSLRTARLEVSWLTRKGSPSAGCRGRAAASWRSALREGSPGPRTRCSPLAGGFASRLGPNILRSETAAVVGGALMVAHDESVESLHE